VVTQGTIPCPGGKKAVGGGINDDGGGLGSNVFVLGTAPKPDGSAWVSAMQNQSGATVNVTAYAVCVTAPTSAAAPAATGQTSAWRTLRVPARR
jgi:hypothetical protein